MCTFWTLVGHSLQCGDSVRDREMLCLYSASRLADDITGMHAAQQAKSRGQDSSTLRPGSSVDHYTFVASARASVSSMLTPR